MKLLLITLLTVASFSATTDETPKKKYIKVLDNNLRKSYYAECKQLKQKNCHYSSFEKAIVLKEV
jgi:hypothetical protein